MKMTQIFIDEIYNTGGGRSCNACTAPSEKGLCKKHLIKARDCFRAWTAKRLNKCLCIKCNKRSHQIATITGIPRQGVYCRNHREENRIRINNWCKENKEYLKLKYISLVQAGLCTSSEKHGPVYRNHKKCKKCHDKRKIFKMIYSAAKWKTKKG